MDSGSVLTLREAQLGLAITGVTQFVVVFYI